MTGIKFNYLVKNSRYEQPKDGPSKTGFELWDTDADTASIDRNWNFLIIMSE